MTRASRLNLLQNWPLLVAGIILVVGVVYMVVVIPPDMSGGSLDQRNVFYPLLIFANATGIAIWSFSLVALIVLGIFAARKYASQVLCLTFMLFGIGFALLANFGLSLPMPFIMMLPVALTFSVFSAYYNNDPERKPYVSVIRVVGVALLGNIALCNASLLLPFNSFEHKDSLHLGAHVYNLAIMETNNGGFSDREALVFRCDSSGLICYEIYTSIPSGGCTVQNQIMAEYTKLAIDEDDNLYLTMGDQKILIGQ